MSTDGRSSPFVVVGTGLVVFMCPSSLVVSGVRRLRAMVAVFDQAWWWWGGYLCLRMSVVIRGWLGWVLLIASGLFWVVGGQSVVAWVFAVHSYWW